MRLVLPASFGAVPHRRGARGEVEAPIQVPRHRHQAVVCRTLVEPEVVVVEPGVEVVVPNQRLHREAAQPLIDIHDLAHARVHGGAVEVKRLCRRDHEGGIVARAVVAQLEIPAINFLVERRLEDVARRRAISNKVFVGNLSFDVTREELIEAFSAAGRVVDAKVPTDRETGRPRGFAFVEFESDEGAKRCIEQLNGRDLKGRPLRVNEAENRPRVPRARPVAASPVPAVARAAASPAPAAAVAVAASRGRAAASPAPAAAAAVAASRGRAAASARRRRSRRRKRAVATAVAAASARSPTRSRSARRARAVDATTSSKTTTTSIDRALQARRRPAPARSRPLRPRDDRRDPRRGLRLPAWASPTTASRS